MNIYLVQRGKFKDVALEKIQGIDSCIEYDYMGSAEFEFGALGESLKRIISEMRKDNFDHTLIKVNFLYFWLYSVSLNKDKVHNIELLFNDPSSYRLKEPLEIDSYFEGKTIKRLKKNCKKKTEVVNNLNYHDFWWDVENDWIVIPHSPYFEERFNLALKKIDENFKRY